MRRVIRLDGVPLTAASSSAHGPDGFDRPGASTCRPSQGFSCPPQSNVRWQSSVLKGHPQCTASADHIHSAWCWANSRLLHGIMEQQSPTTTRAIDSTANALLMYILGHRKVTSCKQTSLLTQPRQLRRQSPYSVLAAVRIMSRRLC